LLLGIVFLFIRPRKPCPGCRKPLPKEALREGGACPACGCAVNAKGEKVEE
jgi:hypothetical protein